MFEEEVIAVVAIVSPFILLIGFIVKAVHRFEESNAELKDFPIFSLKNMEIQLLLVLYSHGCAKQQAEAGHLSDAICKACSPVIQGCRT